METSQLARIEVIEITINFYDLITERANASLHDLEGALTHSPNASLNTGTRAKDQLSAAVHPRTLRWYEAEARPQKYKDAASSLHHILQDTETQVRQYHLFDRLLKWYKTATIYFSIGH